MSNESKENTKGIVYIMSSGIDGLVKIGKCRTSQLKVRKRHLESNGYRNVPNLKLEFAIEVEDYSRKEKLLHSLFDKYHVGDAELFAVDVNLAKALFSSLEGTIKYPDDAPSEKLKTDALKEVAEIIDAKRIPDGKYTLEKERNSGKKIKAIAEINDNSWTILKGSVLETEIGTGVSKKVEKARVDINMDSSGKLLKDCPLGECAPSFAASVVMFGSSNGWKDWKDKHGNDLDSYRQKEKEE